jgi:hypothetical protein
MRFQNSLSRNLASITSIFPLGTHSLSKFWRISRTRRSMSLKAGLLACLAGAPTLMMWHGAAVLQIAAAVNEETEGGVPGTPLRNDG